MNFSKEKNPGLLIFVVFIFLWLVFFLYVGVLTHNPGSDGDDWDFVHFVHSVESGTASLNELTEQYYGAHRVALPRILFYLEYKVFQGKGIFTALFGLFFLSLSFYIIARKILQTSLNQNTQLVLVALGVMLVFNPGQLAIINSQSHSIIRTPIIFIALLAAELLSRQMNVANGINMKTACLTLLLGILALFSDLFGIFIIATVVLATLVTRTSWRIRLFCIVCALIITVYSLPGKSIMHLGNETQILSTQDFVDRAHGQMEPFFPGYFVFLFSYLGMMVSSYLHNIGMIFGVMVLGASCYFLKRELLSSGKPLSCLAIFLFILFIHAMGASLGRYQDSGSSTLERFYIFHCWILWIILIYGATLGIPYKKVWVTLFLSLLLFFSYHKSHDQFQSKIDLIKADVNTINGSYLHDAYKKVSFIHMLLHYNPVAYYDPFLRQHHWGIYASGIALPDTQISNDTCVAKKLHAFIVSEKKFYELRLDAWNVSKNSYLDTIYALDSAGHVVSTGFAIPRQVEFLPLQLLSRNQLQVYMIVPRQFPLNQLTLIGKNQQALCNVSLQQQ